jgi:predicted MFS family arabinose efflux permease
MALNSAQFSMSRATGPTSAGLAFESLGAAGCFYVNSVSFLALIIALLPITVPRHLAEEGPSVWTAMVGGLRYVGNYRTIVVLLSVPSFLSFWGLPFVLLMPVFARDLIKVGASGLCYLMAGAGLGAVISAVTLAAQSGIRQRGEYIFGSAALFALTLILLAQAKSFTWAFLLLVVLGATMVGTLSLVNSSLQLSCPRSHADES